jgi:hypothetical protein
VLNGRSELRHLSSVEARGTACSSVAGLFIVEGATSGGVTGDQVSSASSRVSPEGCGNVGDYIGGRHASVRPPVEIDLT